MINRLLGSLAVCLLFLTAGCGPGTTGTGGGDNADYFGILGASPEPVCGAAWAGNLACQSLPASDPAIAARHPGTLRVQYATDAANPAYVVVFEANRVYITGGCKGVSYDGDWGKLASGATEFFGGYIDSKLIDAVPAQASVVSVFSGGTVQLQFELRAADGSLLLGPLLLQKVNGPELKPAACL